MIDILSMTKASLKFKLIGIYLLAIVVIICYVFFYHRNNQMIVDSGKWVTHTQEVLSEIKKLNTLLVSIESASRGYLVTGDTSFIQNNPHDIKSITDVLSKIRLQTRYNPLQQRNIDSLVPAIQDKLRFLQMLISKRADNRQAAVQMMSSPEEKIRMEKITEKLRQMEKEENGLLTIRIQKNQEAFKLSFYITLLGSSLTAVSLLLLLLQLNKDIKRRETAERAARINEAKYKNLIEDAGVAMFTSDMQGNFQFVSNKAVALTGYSVKELEQMNFEQLVSKDFIEVVRKNYISQVQQQRAESNIQFPIVTRSGQEKWVEQNAVILRDEKGRPKGFQCVVKDIHEQKLMALALEKSESKRKENEARLQMVMENSTSMIFIKDLEGRYLMANKKFKEVFNVTDQYLIGKTDFDFDDRQSAEKYRAVDKWVIETGTPKEVEETVTINGESRYLLINKFPLRGSDARIIGICGITTDITDRKHYEKQLIEAHKTAEEAKKSQEQFLANMSHEIRTPMNGIIGMTHLLLDTPLNKEQKEFVDAVKESANNLLGIINDILDFSKIKSGMLRLEKIEFNPKEVIDKILFSLRIKAREKGLKLYANIDLQMPELVSGDPLRLNQILFNLIGNAIKFTEKGEIRVDTNISRENKETIWVEFTIADTGIGIPADKLDHIFESFAQTNADTARKYGGTGLGLAISKQLVEMQGGQIKVTSELGKGSSFSFSIPYGKIHKPTVSAQQQLQKNRQDLLHNMHLLLVEDNVINQKVAYYTLTKAGAQVTIAANGNEAIQQLQQAQQEIDLVLMDIQMPEMDGYQTTRKIREELGLRLPIIAMTASALKGERDKCIRIGMNDYISKPFVPEELFKKIIYLVKPTTRTMNDSQPKKSNAQEKTLLVDLSFVRELADGDTAYLKDVLGTFLENTPASLQLVRQSIQEKNWEQVFHTAHKMKSSLRIINIKVLDNLIEKIELAARNQQDLDQLPAWIEQCSQIYEQAQSILSSEYNALLTSS